jgi:DNA-binding PadR family transcriptional regulator
MFTLERIVAFCVGALALLKDVIHGRRVRSATDTALLRELAREKSASVPDLSLPAKVSQPAALVALIELEEKGLVRLTEESGAEHVRIAAITEAGRQEVARLLRG